MEYLKTFEWFCFSLKCKSFVKFSKQKMCTVSNFSEFLKDFFASLRSSFFEFTKILPYPREFDHHFLPRGRELDKKNCPGGRDLLAPKKFSPGLPGGMYPVGID